jgi:HlyD family secretion protein
MNVRTNRMLVWGGGAMVLLAVGLALRPGAIPADWVEVTRGRLEVTLDEEGETRVRDRYMVSAPLAGRVLRIVLEPGDPVVAGETILATFQPADPILLDARARAAAEARVQAAAASLDGARATRESARASLTFAERAFERSEQLMANDLVSRDRLDAADTEVRTRRETLRAAEFAVTTSEHELEVARAGVLQARGSGAGAAIALRSPIDGVVLRRLRESESVVPAGDALLELGDPSQLEIVSDMLSADAVQITVGDRVIIDEWGGDSVLQGRVRRVEPFGFTKISALGVEEQRVNVIVDFADAPHARPALGDGYRVEIRVVIWERDDVVKVPTSALFRDGGAWAVYRVERETARVHRIDIGRRTGLEAEVVTGLEPGDRVIVHPSDEMSDGAIVEARTP